MEYSDPPPLTEATVVEHLRRRGVLDPHEAVTAVTPLGGGVSNIVLKVSTPRRAIIAKQPRARLAVAQEWRADVGRIAREHACMQLLEEHLGPGVVPPPLDFDPDRKILAMTAAERAVPWKTQLLDGVIDPATARRVGELLAAVQTRLVAAAVGDRLAGGAAGFEQLRVDPYYRTVARRHPHLAPAIEAVVERMLAVRECLVHGDFSPKNLLVQGERVWLIDHEVAHVGDPAFDVAFVLNHLCLKAVRRPSACRRYFQLFALLWRRYSAIRRVDPAGAFEQHVVRQLGCLLLARVDGKSPVEYLTEATQHDLVRRAARPAIEGRFSTLHEFVDHLFVLLRDSQSA